MIEACFKAFARALRVAVSIDPTRPACPRRRGRSVSEPTRICILDYGMGNLRSVEKALEHVGVARSRSPATPAAVRGADGLILPGVGAFPRAMERIRELGLDELSPSVARPASRSSASASGCSCSSTRRPRTAAPPASACLPGEVGRPRRRGPQGSPHRLDAGAPGHATRG